MSAVPAESRVPSPEDAVPLLNIANVLTGVRLVLVPFFLVALLHEDGTDLGWRLVAALLFAVAAITDRFDGEIARKRGLVTSFGKLADPIADKALMGAALVGLSVLTFLPWWVTVVIMGREVGVTLLRFWVIRHGVIPASKGGKLKTLVQTFAIGFYVLPLSLLLPPAAAAFEVLRVTLMAVAIVLTVVTGLDYMVRAVRLRAAARAPLRRG